jgi:hypothetical protein
VESLDLTPLDAPRSSRRTFLTRSAAGAAAGGVLWVAPAVLTVDAAAAASCVGNTGLVWSNYATGAGSTSGTGTGTGVFATGSGANLVNVTVSTTNPDSVASSGGGGSLGNCFTVIANQIGGNSGKAWYMQMHATAVGQGLTTTFAFSKAVVGLSFSIYDIDRVNNGGTLIWTDKVVITGVKNGGGAASATAAKPGTSTVALTGTPGTSPTYTGTGSANIDPSSPDGNGSVTFNNPVTSVTLTYTAPELANLPSTPFQFMGIGNLSWTGCL